MKATIAATPLLPTTEQRAGHEAKPADSSLVVVVIIAAVILAIVGRVVVHSMDKARIAKYAAAQGWELLSCQWRLFGPGWLGAGKSRLYSIVYTDRSGAQHTAFVKTSALAGVYLTQADSQ